MDTKALRTVPELFLDRVERTPDSEAFTHPTAKGWESATWLQVGESVRAIACGLRALGLEPEARCAILSGTRLEWILADLGVLCAGGATTTIYPGSGADECAYLLKDSDSRFVFAEDAKQLAKLVEKRVELPFVERVIILDGRHRHDHWVITLEELMERGRELDARDHDAYERVARSVRSDALATLIYTSGTTGRPKGVELTHDCWVYESEAVEDLRILSKEDRHYLWLPLSHSFGKLLEVAQLRIGFSTAIDGNVDRMVENLAVIRPTFVCGVPRVFEKIHNRVVLAAAGKVKQRLVRGAFALGVRVAHHRQGGERVPTVLALEDAVADRLVFSKMRERFGGRLRFFISGSAALSREVTEFFLAAKILVLEGYGLTETSAASTGNVPQRFRIGSVGAPVPGTEIKIAEEDGEVLIRGRGVMRGYHNMPAATREVFTADGWLRTGDIGRLDADGFLFITDRKKDLIKTSTGKYVAPQEVEGKLKAICPLLGHVLVHGNNRNFVSALVTLDEDSARAWARNNGRDGASYAELTKDERIIASVQASIDEMNLGLGNHQAIRKFAILPRDFSQETGELTQSLKVKRKVIERENAELLESFYGTA